MSSEVTVVCVYKTGGKDFSPVYVRRLMNSCIANGANTFICLTDDLSIEEFCEIVVLERDLPGWWSKLELFNLPKNKRYVYFDLDTVIHKPISPLLAFKTNFAMMRDFTYADKYASGVMCWSGDHSHLVNNFSKDFIPNYTPLLSGKLGDQEYIQDNLGFKPDILQDRFPSLISSYKLSSEIERKNSSVVCYHGRPRPHQTNWSI